MGEDLYQVSLTDAHGVQWALTRYAPGRKGMWLMAAPDLAAAVEVNARATTDQVGATPVGWHIDPMEGSLKLGFHVEDAPLVEAWSSFVRGFTAFEPSVLHSVLPGRSVQSCRVWLKGEMPEPERSPATPGLRSFEVDVPIISYDGCWRGETTRYTGKNVVVRNSGDLPLYPLVRWSGSGAWVTAPIIGRVDLPDTGTRIAVLDTTPAKSTKVTVDGEPAPDLWRRLRGQVFPLPVPPYSTASWGFHGGAVGLCTPLSTTRWRW